MLAFIDFWVLVSVGLTIVWTRAPTNADGKAVTVIHVITRFSGWIHSINTILPAILLVFAASSPLKLMQAAVNLNVDRTWSIWIMGEEPRGGLNVGDRSPDWLGKHDSFFRCLFLQLSLCVWRAEKLESLLQRMQRSAGVAKREGTTCIKSLFDDPKAYAFDPVWGCTRRLALIAISSFGFVPFVYTTYPTVLFDESLSWVTMKLNDLCERFLQKRGSSVPIWVSFVLMPVLDQLHFIPVIIQIFFLAVSDYPYYTSPGVHSTLLFLCAVAWTVHNINLFYHAVFMDLPENVGQWWEARKLA